MTARGIAGALCRDSCVTLTGRFAINRRVEIHRLGGLPSLRFQWQSS